MLEILDPTNESKPVERPRQERPSTLTNLTVGLLDIAKTQGDLFLDELEIQFKNRGLAVKRYRKPTYAHPAPVALQQQISTEVDVLVEALAD